MLHWQAQEAAMSVGYPDRSPSHSAHMHCIGAVRVQQICTALHYYNQPALALPLPGMYTQVATLTLLRTHVA